VQNPEDRALIIEETHCRAHRGLDENYKQINRLYYWPNLNKKLQEYIENYKTCNSNKNKRHADPRHSTSNGQIERAHSTLTEIARCIKDELNLVDYSEIIIKAAQKYNMTIHSITNQRPYDILYK